MNNDRSDHLISRRNAPESSPALLGGGLVVSDYAEAEIKNVDRISSPSNLKITDLRAATDVKPGPSSCTTVPLSRARHFEPTTQWNNEHSWDRLWS